MDLVTPALNVEEDRVVACDNTIGGAALSLVGMSEGKLDRPDVVIVGGRLEGDGAYLRQPAIVANEASMLRRTLLGKRVPKLQTVTTALLPVRRQDGEMVLPKSHGSPVTSVEVARYIDHLSILTRASGCAAYVLTHLTKILLPEDVRVIGISSYNTMEDLPINTFIERHPNNIPRLRKAIHQNEE